MARRSLAAGMNGDVNRAVARRAKAGSLWRNSACGGELHSELRIHSLTIRIHSYNIFSKPLNADFILDYILFTKLNTYYQGGMSMGRSPRPIPTESELSILNVLWELGPCTVREVQNVLNRTKKTGYTTALKLMQIMTEKKLVKRNESSKTHVYMSNSPKQETQRRLVEDLLRKAFRGSPVELANTLFHEEELTQSEFEKLRNEILALRKKEGDDGLD
jgi:predicted transcriptional regulator